jgi:hypothetical protein
MHIQTTKEITLNDLAVSINNMDQSIRTDMNNSFKEMRDSIDNLAMSTKKGFDDLTGDLNSFKSEMYEFKTEMYEFKDEMLEFKDDMLRFQHGTNGTLLELSNTLETVDGRLYNIEKTLEPIAVAYPIHTRELQSLNNRVSILEDSY